MVESDVGATLSALCCCGPPAAVLAFDLLEAEMQMLTYADPAQRIAQGDEAHEGPVKGAAAALGPAKGATGPPHRRRRRPRYQLANDPLSARCSEPSPLHSGSCRCRWDDE